MRRVIEEAQEIPRGYGIAWTDPRYRRAVCYPVPLNRLIGWLRRIRWDLARPPRGPRATSRDVLQIVETLERAKDHPAVLKAGSDLLPLDLSRAYERAVRLLEKLQRWERAE